MQCHSRKGVSEASTACVQSRKLYTKSGGCQRLEREWAGARTVRIALGQLCALTVQQDDHIRKHTNTNKNTTNTGQINNID